MKKNRRLSTAPVSANIEAIERERGQSPSRPAGARMRRAEASHTGAVCHSGHKAGQRCTALLRGLNIVPDNDDSDEAEEGARVPALASPIRATTGPCRSQRAPAKLPAHVLSERSVVPKQKIGARRGFTKPPRCGARGRGASNKPKALSTRRTTMTRRRASGKQPMVATTSRTILQDQDANARS
jgi:hypothetical protein